MEFKGTPGEWYLGDDCNICSKVVDERVKNHKDEIVKEKDSGEIAQCWEDFHDNTIKPREECFYNALLISKAPQMLKMLQSIVDDFEGDYMVNGVIVDNPYEWLIDRYKEAKQLIKEATELK